MVFIHTSTFYIESYINRLILTIHKWKLIFLVLKSNISSSSVNKIQLIVFIKQYIISISYWCGSKCFFLWMRTLSVHFLSLLIICLILGCINVDAGRCWILGHLQDLRLIMYITSLYENWLLICLILNLHSNEIQLILRYAYLCREKEEKETKWNAEISKLLSSWNVFNAGFSNHSPFTSQLNLSVHTWYSTGNF